MTLQQANDLGYQLLRSLTDGFYRWSLPQSPRFDSTDKALLWLVNQGTYFSGIFPIAEASPSRIDG